MGEVRRIGACSEGHPARMHRCAVRVGESAFCAPPVRCMGQGSVVRCTPMKNALLLLLVAVLGACATGGVSEYRGPDGSAIKTTKCTSDPTKCYAVASQSCAGVGTYRVLSSESHAGGLLADIMPGPVTWYSMTFACGPSDGRMPDFKFGGQQYTPPPVIVQPQQTIIQQPPVVQQPTTTRCQTVGDNTTCRTY